MLTKKDRRHSGRKTVYAEDEEYATQVDEYDDWENYRDGFRHNKDRSFLRSEQMFCMNKEELRQSNQKLKKQILVRKARKLNN